MQKALHVIYLGIILTLLSTLSSAQVIHYTGSIAQSDSTFENLLFYDVTQDNEVYVLDKGTDLTTVKHFGSDLNFINEISLGTSKDDVGVGARLARSNNYGIIDFKIGPDKKIYIATEEGLTIYNKKGEFESQHSDNTTNTTETIWTGIQQIEFDTQWNLYILKNNNVIFKLNPKLEVIEEINLGGQSGYLTAFALDQNNVLYANSAEMSTLNKYDPENNYQEEQIIEQLEYLSRKPLIAVDNQQNIWIHQEGDTQISRYDKDGKYEIFDGLWGGLYNLDKVIFRDDNIYILNFEGQSWQPTQLMKFIFLDSQPVKIIGKRLVPLNSKVIYTAYPDISGMSYEWSFTGSGLDAIGSDYNSDSYNTTNIKSYYATDQMKAGWLICKLNSSGNIYDSVAIYLEPSLRKTPNTLAELTCQDNGYSNCSYGSIQSIQLNDLKNTNTICNDIGYWDFTSDTITGNLYQGQYYSAELQLSKIANQEQYVGVWIDFNNNGDFNDPDEFIGTAISFNGKVKIVNIEVPTNSNYIGDVRMRLRARPLKAFEANEACMRTADIGETEDYTLNISESVGLAVPNAITPNYDGKNDYFVIKGITGNDNALVITDSFGKAIYETKNYQNNWPEQSNKSKLPKGTYFYFYNSGSTSVNGFFVVNY